MVNLTRDADKLLCCIYKQYLERRKSGYLKLQAKRFEKNFYTEDKNISSWNCTDVSDTLLELGRTKYIRLYIGADFDLEDSAIVYMENRFKNGLIEVVDFISKLIP
ncbi:hypothetical protein SAMN02745784_01828 [Tissierella praeacuta DSM 18095]|uniref:Uncharacterized protein n=1 Tax=Tissierella praeacuta DSM 18095 TaxID=1123404 RepID=A0A1M4WEZ3_9FIRM|nr:hypothetical protein [Tissierella praeacuta]SHE79784.1 hypothetical protein SAMN02745784_01828 [Tissierella praeacuta DSM 18095]SUO99488.1 Uncharacterised protein [Tissierella praeacuta]